MRDGYAIVQTFTTLVDAQIAQGALASLGVNSELETDNCGGMRPHLDLTLGIRLLVPDQDADKARDILAGMAEPEPGPQWVCPACGQEVEGNFHRCWSCGRERD